MNKKHNNLTAQHLKLLDDIFVEQDWDKENLFNRFCVSLQFLSETQQKLIIELTKNFLFISFNQYYSLLFKALAEIEQVEFEDVGTIYVLPLLAPKDFDSKVKSSIVLAYLFKDPKIKGHPIFHQKTVHIVNSIKELPKNLNNKQAKVLLIDDFIGTGGTSVEALQYLVETAQILKQKLLILCLVAQQEGLELIKSINISVYSAIIRGKGISDTYDLSTQAKYYKIMESMENLLQVKKDFRFGYKGSEALVKLIRTPNNTFPVYWYEPVMKNGNKYKAPFPRD